MPTPRSDALVFFGATGDLAYKKIFPALLAMMMGWYLTHYQNELAQFQG